MNLKSAIVSLYSYLVMSLNSNWNNTNWDKAEWKSRVNIAKWEKTIHEKMALRSKKVIPDYIMKAIKIRDNAKHIYECARKLNNPVLLHKGYDIESFKRAVTQYDEETAAYNKMLETLQQEWTDAENMLLEEEGKYYNTI